MQHHAFVTSAVEGDEQLTPRPGRFISGTHCIGGWVSPRAGLQVFEEEKNLLTQP